MAKENNVFVSALIILPLFAILSVTSQSTTQFDTVLTRLVLNNGSPLCAVGAPSRVVPLPTAWSSAVTSSSDKTQATSCVPDVTQCALTCRQDSNCTSYNYNQALRRCELFYYRPLNYALNSTCAHYRNKAFDGVCLKDQVVVSAVRPVANGRKVIPAECCGFPFTYNGQLYHRCAQNASDATDIGCLIGNRTWVSCFPPADYSVTYSPLNLTVPNLNGSTPVLSINKWIIILNRFNGTVNFGRKWAAYQAGFGNPPTGEYWLGLEKIRQLTFSAPYRLRFELQTLSEGTWYSAEYYSFQIDAEKFFYALHVAGYCGDAGNGLENPGNDGTFQNGMSFTTTDSVNDNSFLFSCASQFGGGGFWFNNCCYCCLTNPFGSDNYYWHPLTDLKLSKSYQLKASRMMIKLQ